jgi:hypothetical protein
LWALAPLIGFTAQLAGGVGLPAVLTLSVGLGPLIVFTSSFFNQRALWRLGPVDIGCGALSVLALILWRVSGSGTAAIALSIAADGLAGVPTVIKAIKAPETEHHGIYRNAALNGTITLLTIHHWSFASAGFAVYILFMGLLLYSLVRLLPAWRARGEPVGVEVS